ncbi:MAG: helix-turn-helix domain-containing protein [Nakamurella multipartita]
MVKELAGRLAALDPDAGAAVQVIAYFDRLVDGRAGLEAIVRGAAVLAGCPARLIDDERRVRIRMTATGVRQDDSSAPDPQWLHRPLSADGPSALWLERPGPAGPVDLMVLERAGNAARGALERTRGRAAASSPDPALVETVVDAAAPVDARRHAARRLGLPVDGRARALARPGGPATVHAVPPAGASAAVTGRAGLGPAVAVLDLPSSWADARTALRFTADGTEQDPGPRIVDFADLGGLALLAATVGVGTEPVPDVRRVERAAAAAPWVLATLDAIATTASLRAAATALTVHHSTVQERLTHAEHLLGWSVHDPQGRLRLQLALVLRRLHRSAR